MPELAEIKIMSDHINNKCSNKKFYKIWKNPSHKSKTDLSEVEKILSEGAYIKSESRGKELRIDFYNESNNISVYFMMGMSGNFKYTEQISEIPKHTHLKFCSDQYDLCMYDLRRFARWKVDNKWNENRGPCPVTEFDDFSKKIYNSLEGKNFHKPMYDLIMDQEFFNGIGNYLRAEILGRINSNPKSPARDYIKSNPEVITLCNKIPKEAYLLGGGRLKDWYNNEDILDKGMDFRSWMKFYGIREKCFPLKDSKKRTFWIDKKWVEANYQPT